MKVRFLRTYPSMNPEVPFRVGQIVDFGASPPDWVLDIIDGSQAEFVREDFTERAVEPDADQPEPMRVKGRPRHARD